MFVLHHCVFFFYFLTLIWTLVRAGAEVRETIHSELENRTAKVLVYLMWHEHLTTIIQ